MPVVLELTRASIAECMSLPKHVRLEILTVSMGFADVMQSACERYLLEPLQIRRARSAIPKRRVSLLNSSTLLRSLLITRT